MTFRYQFFGGEYNRQTMTDAEVRKIADGATLDLTKLRMLGGCVHRKELDSQPTVPGYCGPMWDGMRFVIGGKTFYDFQLSDEQKAAADDSYAVLRYETQEVYNMMSN